MSYKLHYDFVYVVQAVVLGRKAFPREVYLKTHTKKGDGRTFINEKSKKVNVSYSIALNVLNYNCFYILYMYSDQ